jgi:hypothetical protein
MMFVEIDGLILVATVKKNGLPTMMFDQVVCVGAASPPLFAVS